MVRELHKTQEDLSYNQTVKTGQRERESEGRDDAALICRRLAVGPCLTQY